MSTVTHIFIKQDRHCVTLLINLYTLQNLQLLLSHCTSQTIGHSQELTLNVSGLVGFVH